MNTNNPAPPPPFGTPAQRLARAARIAGAVPLSQVAPENIHWPWPGRIPLGRVTLLVSDPGVGKSLLTLDIAARVSRGTPWPDSAPRTAVAVDGIDEPRVGEGEVGRVGEPMHQNVLATMPTHATPNPQSANQSPHSNVSPSPPLPVSPSSVLLLTAEDNFADTVRPRLEALGADCDRILGIATVPGDKPQDVPRAFALNRDLARLRNLLDALPDCRLIVIDPISACLGGTNEQSNSDVQSLLLALTAVAREYNVAVVIVSHLRKQEGAAIYRTMGSLAFVAASRATWAISKDSDVENKRLLLPVKNNLAPHIGGLAFTIETSADLRAPTIHWSPEPVTHSIDLAFARANGRPDDERRRAIEWLRDRLSQGPRAASELKVEADVFGIAGRTLRRAFHELNGEAVRRGPFPFGQWKWKLPGVDGQNPEEEFWTSTDALLEELARPFMRSSPSPTPVAPNSPDNKSPPNID